MLASLVVLHNSLRNEMVKITVVHGVKNWMGLYYSYIIFFSFNAFCQHLSTAYLPSSPHKHVQNNLCFFDTSPLTFPYASPCPKMNSIGKRTKFSKTMQTDTRLHHNSVSFSHLQQIQQQPPSTPNGTPLSQAKLLYNDNFREIITKISYKPTTNFRETVRQSMTEYNKL
jgi:hypothetical protein